MRACVHTLTCVCVSLSTYVDFLSVSVTINETASVLAWEFLNSSTYDLSDETCIDE